MAVKSGFFNSSNGDRVYNAEDMSRYFEGLVSSGVFANPSDSLQVTANGENMVVSIQPGRGIIDCHWVNNDSTYDIVISASNELQNRIDAIVMRYNVLNREIVFAVKTGTPATNPVAPTMLRTETTQEYCLATIKVNKGVIVISQSDITDTRPNTDVCGWITNLVDNIDISALNAQWQAKFAEQSAEFDAYMQAKEAEFDSWYAQLTSTLSVPTVIKKYEGRTTTTGSTTTMPIPVSQYVNGDALLVHLGGMLLAEGVDYTVDGTSIIFPSAVGADRTYTFIVFKPSIE